MDLGLQGRVVVVTGGALGIGRGIVDAFIAAGASVAISDIDRDAAFFKWTVNIGPHGAHPY